MPEYMKMQMKTSTTKEKSVKREKRVKDFCYQMNLNYSTQNPVNLRISKTTAQPT